MSDEEDGYSSDYFGNIEGDIRDILPSFPIRSARMLASDDKHDGGERGRHISMAQFAKADTEAFEDLAAEIESVGRDFIQYFRGEVSSRTRRYLSDVILYRGDEQLQELISTLFEYGESRTNGIFGFSVEDDHIHVIHDCSYGGNYCRCVFRQKVKPSGELTKARKFNRPIWAAGLTDWYDVFIYFFLAKRGTRNLWIRGENKGHPSDADIVRWERKYKSWQRVVESKITGDENDYSEERRKRESVPSGTSNSFTNEFYGTKPKTGRFDKYGAIKMETRKVLLKYFPSPFSAIKSYKEFRECALLSNPKNRDYVETSINDVAFDINQMSLRDLRDLHYDRRPTFFQSFEYTNDEDSLQLVINLLKYQYDDNEDNIKAFLTDLVDILDKKIPKLNTIAVKSPPQGGKNFFFDMIFALVGNYGQLTTINRNNLFAFQDAYNRRLLWWNEPQYESCQIEFLKLVTAGDPYNVRVKQLGDQHVQRTPLIITTNNDVSLFSNPAFYERISLHRWKTAAILADVRVKPYPLCFFDLLDYYDITY